MVKEKVREKDWDARHPGRAHHERRLRYQRQSIAVQRTAQRRHPAGLAARTGQEGRAHARAEGRGAREGQGGSHRSGQGSGQGAFPGRLEARSRGHQHLHPRVPVIRDSEPYGFRTLLRQSGARDRRTVHADLVRGRPRPEDGRKRAPENLQTMVGCCDRRGRERQQDRPLRRRRRSNGPE